MLGWSAKRELSKINYRIHTDAIKSNLIPQEVTPLQASIIYAEEADVLNVAMFGDDSQAMARCQPRVEGKHTRLCHNQRTHLPFEYGKHQCRAHQRRHCTGRPTRETQPDSYTANAGVGGEWKSELAEIGNLEENH